MKVFAKVGAGAMQVGGECPPGYIEMNTPRPTGAYIVALENGDWGEAVFLKADALRAARDQRLRNCDIRVLPDYPQTDDERAAWLAYRQALRDLPQQNGFPWNGPDDPAVPWPSAPAE